VGYRANSLRALLLITCVWFGTQMAYGAEGKPKDNCLDCHSVLDPPVLVDETAYAQNIHVLKGLSCTDCHGGDLSSETVHKRGVAGFKGKITRGQVPELCGKCHSDGAYMRKYNPSLRTDQLSQYHTSVHGKLRAKGDDKAAICTDCHSVHEIRAPSDSKSTVNPLNVAKTCQRCHADREYMAPYKIPTSQYAEYTTSVHFEAMSQRGDLSAPTCTTCHGNHGAAPPAVSSVSSVCSTCHVFQAQLFDASPHKAVFVSAETPGCVTCHGNHHIRHPNDAMLGVGKDSICTDCHTKGDKGYDTAQQLEENLTGLRDSIQRSANLLNRAEEAGMEVSQAQLDLSQARDALTKARVTVHALKMDRVDADLHQGHAIAAKTYQAGEAAMRERDQRRKGLALSVLAILLTVAALAWFIHELERGQQG
jgi:cytochrome c3-like protein